MNTSFSNSRPLDDIDVLEQESAIDAAPASRIEFATFTEGDYVESILIDRARALEIYRDLGTNLSNAISHRETATILAALRYWQLEGLISAGHERDIAEEGGRLTALSAPEIDTLCEKINSASY